MQSSQTVKDMWLIYVCVQTTKKTEISHLRIAAYQVSAPWWNKKKTWHCIVTPDFVKCWRIFRTVSRLQSSL